MPNICLISPLSVGLLTRISMGSAHTHSYCYIRSVRTRYHHSVRVMCGAENPICVCLHMFQYDSIVLYVRKYVWYEAIYAVCAYNKQIRI